MARIKLVPELVIAIEATGRSKGITYLDATVEKRFGFTFLSGPLD